MSIVGLLGALEAEKSTKQKWKQYCGTPCIYSFFKIIEYQEEIQTQKLNVVHIMIYIRIFVILNNIPSSETYSLLFQKFYLYSFYSPFIPVCYNFPSFSSISHFCPLLKSVLLCFILLLLFLLSQYLLLIPCQDACEGADGVRIAGRRLRVSLAKPRHRGPRERFVPGGYRGW